MMVTERKARRLPGLTELVAGSFPQIAYRRPPKGVLGHLG